jgi:uncharacterized BrkB/YihY/UPF0761 family membrane protein
MDQGLENRLSGLEKKVEKIWHSVEQTRKIFLWTAIISIVLFILTLIGLLFALPTYLNSLDISGLLE